MKHKFIWAMMFLLIISFVFAEDELRYSTNPKSFSQDDGARLVYGTDYKIIKMKGNESNMPPVFEESSVNVSVDGDNTSIFERRVIICLDAKFESINTEKNVSKAKRVYTPPVTLNYLQNAEEKSVDRELKKRRSNTGKNFESGDSYLYCVSANPKTDFYFKFGDNTIEIIQSTTISTDLFLTNVTDEPIFTHLNISRSDVLLYMSFDKDNLTHTIDLSNNNFDGTNEGDAKNNAVGIIGKAISLDGSGDRINLGDVADNTGDNFTISAWIKTRDFSADGMVVAKKDDAGAGYYMFITFTGEFNARFDDSLMFVDATATTFVNDDAWHHLVAVRSGDELEVYVDTVQEGSGMGSGIGSTANTANLLIGKSDHSMDYSFNGLIDQVIIFNTTLTSAEITELYNNQSVNIFATTGTQHYLSFNESGLTDENQVNITTQGYERLLGTDISIAVGQWNYTDEYDETDEDLLFSIHFDNRTDLGENATNFLDSAQFHINGTASGFSNNRGTPGKYHLGLDFDGTNDRVDFGTPNELKLQSSMTLSAWVNPDTDESFAIVQYDNVGGTRGYGLTPGTDGTGNKFRLSLANTGNSLIKRYSTTTVASTIGSWHHIVGVYDAPAQTMDIYIDGVIDNGVLQGTIPSSQQVSNGQVKVGNFHGFDADFNGQLDEIQIYNKSFSSNEVKELYIKGKLNFQFSGDKLLDNQNSDDNVSWNIFDINNATKNTFITRYTMHNNNNNSYTPYLGDLDVNFTFFFLEDVLAPRLNFTTPTPADTATVTTNFVTVNTSIDDLNLEKINWEWNGTNTTIINGSTLLFMNFDNRSAIGDSNTVVQDLSTFDNDGTLTADAFINLTNGKYGGALDLDGTGDFVNVGSTIDDDFSNTITFGAWINPRSLGVDAIIDQTSSPTIGLGLHLRILDSGGKIRCYTGDVTGGTNLVDSLTAVSTNSWTHIMCKNNATDLVIYINGVKDNVFHGASAITKNGNDLLIGDSVNFAPIPFNGFIDDALIINQPLSDEAVTQLYLTSLTKFNNTYWEFYINQSENGTAQLADGDYTYRTHAGDTFDNTNQTDLRTVTVDTTPVVIVNTCNYGGTGNLECNCAVNNTLSSNIFGDRTGNFSARGDGTLTVNGTVTGFNQYFIGDGCIMYKIDGVTIGG